MRVFPHLAVPALLAELSCACNAAMLLCLHLLPQALDSSLPRGARCQGHRAVREVTLLAPAGLPVATAFGTRESCRAGAGHSHQGWLGRFGATKPGGPTGQFLQERRAWQLPWHQRVWEVWIIRHTVLAHGWNCRNSQDVGHRRIFSGESPASQDISGHGLTQHRCASPAQCPLWSPSPGMTNTASEICILKQ